MPRVQVHVQGVVQGVGFRPFVYRIALERQLAGWVRNRPDGVALEIEGPAAAIQGFLAALERERPAPARIRALTVADCPETGETGFRILASGASAETRPSVPADLALCPECAAELTDPAQRRFGYPFTNCTYCGPRFTIIEGLPYDRPRTAMKGFPLCPACAREYRDPLDRRFHAQPVACPECGPQVSLLGRAGAGPALHRQAALDAAVAALLAGEVLALKGLGGFQLLVDATSEAAVARLRERKRREEKPFAVMFGSLEAVRAACAVSAAEAALLAGPEAPVLLLTRLPGSAVVEAVAPRNPRLGTFLPYTPLHALLLTQIGRPLVCTSGNLSDEPMCFEEADAFERLGAIADRFLVHDRPILRPVDDSVLRLDAHGPTLLRRARGFAPLAHPLAAPGTVLALGAQQKNAICLLTGGQAVVSQHLGDLHSAEGVELLERTVADFLDFFQAQPDRLACDLHPDYASTRLGERLAKAWDRPLLRVQHHHAHVAAGAAEFGLDGALTGLAWDGSGLGSDGTIWGGEALTLDGPGFGRCGHLATFPLPGGERAVRDPARSALGLLWAAFGPRALELARDWFPPAELRLLGPVLERGLNAPRTSSIGRLFDGVAALLGIRSGPGFEGQAAMEVEFAARRGQPGRTYEWSLLGQGPVLVADPAPMLERMLAERGAGVAAEDCALGFHQALAELALAFARHAGRERVLLTGGCFQNGLLTRLVRAGLAAGGFQPFSPMAFPPNDGAISLGQAAVAAWSDGSPG
jgi:hydrogenase maturation protein HypF